MRHPTWWTNPATTEPPPPTEWSTDTWVARCQYVSWQQAYMQYLSDLPQAAKGVGFCSWCGELGNDWCESCMPESKIAHALCYFCEARIRQCRLCRRRSQERYSAPGALPSTRPVPQSAWCGVSECGSCGKRAEGHRLCSGCKCVRYCSTKCQKNHWLTHKQLCQILRRPQPVRFVYPWHVGADAARYWRMDNLRPATLTAAHTA